MRSFLAMFFYIDYKCSSEPRFRKTLLVLTLIFVFLLWSPWRPLLCPVFGVCPAPVVRADVCSPAQSTASPGKTPQTSRANSAPKFQRCPLFNNFSLSGRHSITFSLECA